MSDRPTPRFVEMGRLDLVVALYLNHRKSHQNEIVYLRFWTLSTFAGAVVSAFLLHDLFTLILFGVLAVCNSVLWEREKIKARGCIGQMEVEVKEVAEEMFGDSVQINWKTGKYHVPGLSKPE
jgi:uncharacterized membrane protein